jgi:uncharacterized protein (TIGR02099 family)
MPTRFRRGLRHARRGLSYTCALVLILLAMAVAIADRLLPWVQEHPDTIAAWLIARSGRPVHFDHAEAYWTNRGPVFALYNLRIGEGKQQLAVDRAELLVAMYAGLLPDHPFTELRLRGLALTVERDAAGRWHFVGLSGPTENENHDPLENLEGLGELQVADARLTVRAPELGIAFTSPKVDLRMRVSDKRLRAGIRTHAASGSPLLAVLDFDRQDNSGTLWVGGDGIDLTPWSPILGYAGAQVGRGSGQVGIWTTLQDRRVVSVQVEASLRDLELHSRLPFATGNNMPAVGVILPEVKLSELTLSARWKKFSGGWEVVAPKLQLHAGTTEDVLDGLAVRDTGNITLSAPKMDVGMLLSIAMLSDRVPPGLRDWLTQAAPKVKLSALRVDATQNGTTSGQAILDDVSWSPVGTIPALQGVGGTLRFDNDAVALELRNRQVELLWPPALGDPLPLTLEGDLTAWRDGNAWTVETSSLRSHNADIDLQTRLAMRFGGGGEGPRLDLYSIVQPAHMLAAKRYWIRHRMSPNTIAWLDRAIEGGMVAGGHVLVSGDLDDWPFRHKEGRFEAVADLADAQIRFSPEWPRAEHVNGRLVFDGLGMYLAGSGSVLGVQAPQINVAIPEFRAAVLDIQAAATGSGAQMLALLRQSPLQKRNAETFAAVDVQGEGQSASMHLQLPLGHEPGEHKVDGDVQLTHARLSDSRWNLMFTDVSGRVHYDQDGLLADALAVHVKDDPATFRLAIGGATADPATAVDAQLRGTFPVTTLIAHAPTLDWLKPIILGRTAWTVEVKVPRTAEGARSAPTQLNVTSDLNGAELVLPVPLGKPANQSLALQVHTLLQANAGDINVKLGDLLTVRGRYDGTQPFRGLLALGGGDANGALPAQGLSVSGRVSDLDGAGWIAFASSGTGGAGGLQTLDLQAESLALGGRHFADTRVRMTRLADATTVRLDGDAIAGSITVPTELARGIRGQFDRIYWPGSSSPATGTSMSGSSAAGATPTGGLLVDADTDMDPTKVPPLHLDVADLRFGDAKLGKMTLQTRPIPQGLRIDQLDMAAKSQTVSATGDWTRQSPTATHTRLAIDFRADSLGKMLDAFGFKGVIDAGKTQAKLQGDWPGSPTAFRLAVLNGTLDLNVGAGRLLEVKPGGAGRVLGLVSLADLPRRLGLDFRDFFDKGFSFDTMRGHFVFAAGQARTDDLAIKGPAAEIHVTGSADLVAHRYDQTIEVLPKAGGIVTAVGALAGGPIGAAVGAVAGVVLKHPLQQMSRKRYHVTGPWSNPDVQTMSGGTTTAALPSEPVSG